jgi:hypothetical protein
MIVRRDALTEDLARLRTSAGAAEAATDIQKRDEFAASIEAGQREVGAISEVQRRTPTAMD